MVIGGSSTRNEKNWQSSVFSQGGGNQKTKKLLSKADGGYGALYGDEKVKYERKSMNQGFHKNSQSMSKLEMIPVDYSATKRSQREFYGERAALCSNNRFQLKDLISPAADFSNPQHAPQMTHKNYNENLLAIPERRTRQDRIKNNASNIFGVKDEYYKTTIDIHQKEDKISSSQNWNSVAASRKPNNKGSVNAYKMRQNELGSQIFEQTDYSSYQPLNKKKFDAETEERELIAKQYNKSSKQAKAS